MLHTFFGDPTRLFFFAATPKEFCEANNGFRTSIQGLAAYTIPKIDVQISGTFQNLPGCRRPVERQLRPLRHRWCRSVHPVQGVPDRRAWCALCRASEPDRFSRVKDPPIWHDADGGELRLLQRHELQLGAQRELRVFGAECESGLEIADLDPAAAAVQVQRAVRFLEAHEGTSERTCRPCT